MAELEEIRGFFFYRKLYLKTGHGSPCSSQAASEDGGWTFAAAIKRSASQEEVRAETKLIVAPEEGKAVQIDFVARNSRLHKWINSCLVILELLLKKLKSEDGANLRVRSKINPTPRQSFFFKPWSAGNSFLASVWQVSESEWERICMRCDGVGV